jgi:hypothetical protein
MAKNIQVQLVEKSFEKNGKTIKFNALVLEVQTLNGVHTVQLTANNAYDKFVLKEYLKTVK